MSNSNDSSKKESKDVEEKEVVRKKDGAKWHLSGKVSLSKLREIRSQIKNEVLLRNILETNNIENV